MLYMHSRNVLHLHLHPSIIFLDEYLFPKLTEFSFSRFLSNDSKIMISLVNIEYCPPEVRESQEWRKNSDVFSFALIAYEIWTNEIINDDYDFELLLSEGRPEFKTQIPNCYRELIEKCWSQDPNERPSFDEIVYQLRTNPDFITDTVNKDEFFDYVNYCDGAKQDHSFKKVFIDYSKYRNSEKLHFSINIETVDLKNYDKKEKIGRGGFGVVYKVLNKETDEINAAKSSIYEIDQCDKDFILNLTREVDIISKIEYPSILRFIGYNPFNFKLKSKPTIITEYALNGSLDIIIKLERNSMAIPEWNDTKKLINLYGIAMGMSYLHSKNIIHRDLKPANIFLDEYLYPKIGDFGLSKEKNEKKEINNEHKITLKKRSGFKGTLAYCAPEILRKCEYTYKGDVYAYGMIAYEIITSSDIFVGLNQYQMVSKLLEGYRPEFKQSIPYCYRKLIERCWSEDPKQRPDFYSICSLLKSDKDFITDCVDEDEYLNYIDLFEDFENNDNKKNISFVVNSKSNESTNNVKAEIKNDMKIIVQNKEQKIIEDESNNYNFLDLSKFERQNIIFKGDFFKIYQVKNKETGSVYAAKISMININQFTRDQVINLSREVNIISQINHPSFLKFIGYSLIDFKKESNPVIITELSSNGTLHQILEMERKKLFIADWNDTKKLINIYGIASAMSFLHSHNILHRDLKPQNIYLDDFLYPKIGDFGLSTKFHSIDSLTYQSISGLKGTPVYSAPEVLQDNYYSKSSDVYAFSFIVFEIITNEIPFQFLNNNNQIYSEIVIKGNRPQINKNIPDCYRNLIEKLWSQNPDERPTFNEIENLLKTDSSFISMGVNKSEYFKYIQMIDEFKASYNSKEKILQLDDLIKDKSRVIENDDNHSKANNDSFNNDYNNATENNNINHMDSIKNDDNNATENNNIYHMDSIKNDYNNETENNNNNNNNTSENDNDLNQELIQKYISSKKIKELMEFLNNSNNNDLISSIFDKFYYENQDIYLDLCKEGILLNNSVAYHKYELLLMHAKDSNIINYKKARFHLEESIKLGFIPSYFSLARLMHEIFNENQYAFQLLNEGANKGDIYSICLLGHFIANGIGTKKNFSKGILMIIESGATELINNFATEIGIYFAQLKETDKNFDKKAFEWFEKAYNISKTNATINNYGICYLKGFGTQKNINKAKEIFIEGIDKGFVNSSYHMEFILEKANQ